MLMQHSANYHIVLNIKLCDGTYAIMHGDMKILSKLPQSKLLS